MDIDRAREGRRLMAERCQAVATLHTPSEWTVIYRKTLSGRAYFHTKRIEVPRPTTRRALHIYLHECAHVHLGHGVVKVPRYVQEYQAEQWAFARMRDAGIAIPRKSIESAKRYVGQRIGMAWRRGLRVADKNILRWVGVNEAWQLSQK